MNAEEKARIDRITAAVHRLLKGDIPDPIPGSDAEAADEIQQLSAKVNQLIQNYGEIRDALIPLSQGELDITIPKGNFLASPFKQLQASLKHLTWQTRQIAHGDFSQRVDFMGDFSAAFNAMVKALEEAQSQLLSRAEHFKNLAEIKDRYLSIMAHDIRTPLGAILGFADILLEGKLGAAERQQVEVIRRNCESLLELINNLLDMARLEKGKLEIDAHAFSLQTLTGDIQEMIRPKLGQETRFSLAIDPDIPEPVTGDSHRLYQVLVNLVGNAAKFTEKGEVKLTITPEAPGESHWRLRFEVADTGIGIPLERQADIFTPFSQAEAGTASRYGGSGLGLSIARELVALMGGELELESRPGQGTRFYFSLDLGVPAETAAPAEQETAPPLCRCHILVVDDNPYALKIIERLLNRHNVRFSLCRESQNAYDILVAAYENGDPYTLGWIDIDMPEVDGFQLAARIRGDERLKPLRLVACTSHVDKLNHHQMPHYFSFVATKPISPQALRRILEEASTTYPPVVNPACHLSGRSLLVVDDNPLNRFIVKSMAQKLNIRVEEAENGQEGLDMLGQQRFDLVLMDRMMPGISGLEAIASIRQRYPELPVLAFTASGQADGDAMIRAGANGRLSKPLIQEHLVETLCQVLK